MDLFRFPLSYYTNSDLAKLTQTNVYYYMQVVFGYILGIYKDVCYVPSCILYFIVDYLSYKDLFIPHRIANFPIFKSDHYLFIYYICTDRADYWQFHITFNRVWDNLRHYQHSYETFYYKPRGHGPLKPIQVHWLEETHPIKIEICNIDYLQYTLVGTGWHFNIVDYIMFLVRKCQSKVIYFTRPGQIWIELDNGLHFIDLYGLHYKFLNCPQNL